MRLIKKIVRVEGRILDRKIVIVILFLTFFELTPLNWILTMGQLPGHSLLDPLEWIFVRRIYYRFGLMLSSEEITISQLTFIFITNIDWLQIQSLPLVLGLLILIHPYKLLVTHIWECSCYDVIKLIWIGVIAGLNFWLKINVMHGKLSIRILGWIVYWRVRVLRTQYIIISFHQSVWGYDQFYSSP